MIYAFGQFELDTRVYELRQGGSIRPVEPQVFDVLAYLVNHRDRVVSKDELLDKLWPDRFVSETTLTSRLKEARKAVGDDGKKQLVIRTQRGRGYRFVAAVEERGDPAASGLVACVSGDHLVPRSEEPEESLRGFIEQVASVDPEDHPGFVGRREEIRKLTDLLTQALGGKRQIAFVIGEGGAGKTTLVDTFLADAPPDSPVLIARGQCVEYRGSGEPYMPLLDAFGRLLRSARSNDLIPIFRREAPSWLLQMPSMLSESELVSLRESIGSGGERMARELGLLVEQLTAERPLILVLEDLHWSDYATLDAIDLLARQTQPARLLIIGTWRPSDVKAARHPVYALTQELRVKEQCEVIPLAPFAPEELRFYLEARFGDSPFHGNLASVLHARTAGNALFVRNLVDSWVERDLIRLDRGGWKLESELSELERDVPDTLQHLIENQIAELDPEQQRVLEIASVIGRRFPVSLVAATLPAADDDLERICERLTRESSILESAGTEQWGDGALTSSYAFTHDLYVDVVYEGIPALRRARLHQLVGQALERAWEGREREHAPELALHFHRSSDHSRGPKYLHLAAEHALERSAYREAVDHLSAAIEMLEGAPESGDRQRLELRIRCRLAPSLVATRGWADSEAEENYLKARDLAEELEEFALLSQTLYGLANMYEYRGEYALAERIARKRLALDETGVPTQSLESNELLTCSLLHQGRYGESVRHGEEALAAYADVDPVTLDPEELVLIVQAHGWMSASLHFAGRIDDALSHSREAIRLAEGIDNQLAKASAHIQGAFLRFYRCEEDACGELARRGGAISREFRFPFHVACSRILQGWTLSGADEPGDAVREIRAGIRTSEAIGARMDLPLFYSILAGALVRSGDPEKALNASDRAIEILDRGRTFFYVPELHRQRGLILLDLGRSDEGLESLDEAFELAQSQECLLFALRAATDLARLGKKTWETRVGKIYDRFSQGLDTKDLEKAAAILK